MEIDRSHPKSDPPGVTNSHRTDFCAKLGDPFTYVTNTQTPDNTGTEFGARSGAKFTYDMHAPEPTVLI